MVWLCLFHSPYQSPIPAISNSYKLRGLKQHSYITVSVGQMSRHNLAQLNSQDQNQGVNWFEVLSGDSGEESTSKFIHTVGIIQFVMVLGLRLPFPCWLSAGIYPQLQRSLPSLHVALCTSESAMVCQILSGILDFVFHSQGEKTLLSRAHLISLGQSG